MSLDDSQLRDALIATADHQEPNGCPAPDHLWAGASGELETGATLALVDHVSRCGACAEAWALAVAVREEAGLAEHRDPARVPANNPRGWARWLAMGVTLAAAAVLVVRVGIGFGEQEPNTYREGAESALTTPEPERTVRRGQPVSLTWVGPETARYTVTLTTESLQPVDRAEGLGATTYIVPAERLADLEPGTRVIWRVQATTPAGDRWSSPNWTLHIEQAGP